ncbi:SDR family NAD(P)-dependent oxidoreductase [Xanthobacteraceae bacterium A53D]
MNNSTAPVLTGKVAIVTGAASGIGRAQARLFAAAGAQVVAVDRDATGIEATMAEIAAAGHGGIGVVADLLRAEDIARIVDTATGQFGRIDILGNTAGLHDGYARSLDTSEEMWERVMAVNVTAVFRLTNAVLPGMLAQGGGVIVNIASVASTIAGGGGAAYTASKHAVLGYTRQLAYDYGRKGIRANAVCPGMIETGMTRDVLADPDSKLVKAVKAVPAGRYGSPEDIAAAALFLASDASAFMHGAAMLVDGGLTVK